MNISEEDLSKYIAVSVVIQLQNLGFPVPVNVLRTLKEAIYKDLTLANSMEKSIKSYDKEVAKLRKKGN